jgi:hypothetical protein
MTEKRSRINPRITGRRESLPPPWHTHRSHAAKAASMGLMYGGKLQDQINQLRNIDYALIERRMMVLLG